MNIKTHIKGNLFKTNVLSGNYNENSLSKIERKIKQTQYTPNNSISIKNQSQIHK
jgi:hypothetical protein